MRKYFDECDYLIHLVRCAVHDLQPRELPKGLDFQRVYEWGLYHQIGNIAFCSVEKLKTKPREALYRRWQDCRDQAIVRDITQNYAAMEIRDAFQNAGIRVLEVQGTKIKPLYPQSNWRTMSDLDFIIDPENLPKAMELLEKLGYRCQNIQGIHVDAHRPPNINVELHTEFFEEDAKYRQVLRSPFARVDEQGQCPCDVFYLYNILHITKHYFSAGCGIRRVLDAYYLNQVYGPVIDAEQIHHALETINAGQFAADLEKLAQAWFGLEETRYHRNRLAEHIIHAGLHGNLLNEWQYHMEEKFDPTIRFAKLRYYLRRFFGTDGVLRKRYPVLQRYPILYPFCWFWRIVSTLSPSSLKRVRREVKTIQQIPETEE